MLIVYPVIFEMNGVLNLAAKGDLVNVYQRSHKFVLIDISCFCIPINYSKLFHRRRGNDLFRMPSVIYDMVT